MTNILYIGMADDIISPLLLCPDFDTLFVIDIFNGYSEDGTFENQKKLIIDTLINGYTKMIPCECDPKILYYSKYIGGMATVISNTDTNIIDTENTDDGENLVEGGVWTLKFEWNGKIRTMIRYEMNMNKSIWPTEIVNISHIITIGCIDWNSVVKNYIHTGRDNSNPNSEPDPDRPGYYQIYSPKLTLQFRSMIETRTILPFKWTQTRHDDSLMNIRFIENGRGKYVVINYDPDSSSIVKEIPGFLCINENTRDVNISHGWDNGDVWTRV